MKKILIASLLLTGCATTYTHPTKTAADFAHDKDICQHVGEQSAANWGSQGNIFMIIEEMKKCLTLQYGWVAN